MSGSHLHVVELYAGTARSVEPFRQWGRCRVSLLVDASEYAAKTYRANYRKAPYVVANLNKMKPEEIRTQAGGRIDILLGCPPCQGWSENGQRLPSDPRNRHLHHFGRAAEALRPLAVGLENVPLAAASVQFRRFTNRLEQAGYSWTAGIINAALRGSPQCRLRLILVAIRGDVGVAPAFPAPTHGAAGKYHSYRFGGMKSIASDRNSMLGIPASVYKFQDRLPYWEADLGPKKIPRIGETLDGLPAIGTPKAVAVGHFQWAHKQGQLHRMARVPEGGRWKGGLDHYSQSYGRLHRLGLARTITTAFPNAGSGRFWHPTENRSLTLREAARIQGFPDSFTFLTPFSRAAVLVGNAIDAYLANVTYQIVRLCIE